MKLRRLTPMTGLPLPRVRTPVPNNSLGQWDTSILTPGDYQLRLVVTNTQGQSLPPCIIPLRITAP